MASASNVDLLNFFVFNATYAKTEGEEKKKILYFYPAQTDIDSQLKNAGLCEALIKFTASFSPDKPCQTFCSEKTKQFLLEPEDDFWIVMTVSAPSVTKTTVNVRTTEYHSEKIQENVYSAVLSQAYRMFRLFHGTFKAILGCKYEDEERIEVLKEKLELFYSHYLPNLRLGHCDILDVFQGISFLPLGKEPFLHVQSFINHVETTFPSVRYSAFLYNDQLVWSGVESSDMQVLYQFLIHTLLPSHLDLELQGASLPNNTTLHHYGSFVTGPADLKDSVVSTMKVPLVYLHAGDTEECHLVVYRALSATVCLLLEGKQLLSLELFKQLDSHVGPKLTALVSEVSEYCARQSQSNALDQLDAKFLYFNKLNLAHKSTAHLDNRRAGSLTVAQDLVRIVADVNAEKADCNGFGEVVMKTLNDCWLVAKYSNSREFYVIVTQKKASLIEINEEVKRVSDSQLKGIFFMD